MVPLLIIVIVAVMIFYLSLFINYVKMYIDTNLDVGPMSGRRIQHDHDYNV